MRRDALRRAAAAVRPAVTLPCLTPLCLAFLACQPGPSADGAPLDPPVFSADPLDPRGSSGGAAE